MVVGICKVLQSDHHFTTAFHPQEDGVAQRTNRQWKMPSEAQPLKVETGSMSYHMWKWQ